jgi:hypothetical protein
MKVVFLKVANVSKTKNPAALLQTGFKGRFFNLSSHEKNKTSFKGCGLHMKKMRSVKPAVVRLLLSQ